MSAGLGYFDLSLTAAAEDAAAEGVEASLNSGPVGGYLGLGFGNVAAAQGLIGVTFDLGVILTGAKVEAAEDSGIDELLSSVGIDPGRGKGGVPGRLASVIPRCFLSTRSIAAGRVIRDSYAAAPCSRSRAWLHLVGALARRVAAGAVPGGVQLVGNLRPMRGRHGGAR